MDELQVLPATTEERKWAAKLLSENDPWNKLAIPFAKILQNCNDVEFLLYVAHSGKNPCGVIIVDPRGVAGSPYIKSIAVATEYRNLGIGAALIHFTEEHFRSGSRYIFLCVSSFNFRARALYEKLGYRDVGELKIISLMVHLKY